MWQCIYCSVCSCVCTSRVNGREKENVFISVGMFCCEINWFRWTGGWGYRCEIVHAWVDWVSVVCVCVWMHMGAFVSLFTVSEGVTGREGGREIFGKGNICLSFYHFSNRRMEGEKRFEPEFLLHYICIYSIGRCFYLQSLWYFYCFNSCCAGYYVESGNRNYGLCLLYFPVRKPL